MADGRTSKVGADSERYRPATTILRRLASAQGLDRRRLCASIAGAILARLSSRLFAAKRNCVSAPSSSSSPAARANPFLVSRPAGRPSNRWRAMIANRGTAAAVMRLRWCGQLLVLIAARWVQLAKQFALIGGQWTRIGDGLPAMLDDAPH